MSNMNLKEALESVREMGNFFKGFKNLEEIIEAGANLEQNIKDMELARDKVASEIKSLTEKKDAADVIMAETTANIKAMKAKYASETRTEMENFEAEKKRLFNEMDEIKDSKLSLIASHAKAMETIDMEIKSAKDTLAAIKEELEKIKGRL